MRIFRKASELFRLNENSVISDSAVTRVDCTIQHLNLLTLSSGPQPQWMTLEEGAYVRLESKAFNSLYRPIK